MWTWGLLLNWMRTGLLCRVRTWLLGRMRTLLLWRLLGLLLLVCHCHCTWCDTR